jgi:hypothetical protein
MERQISELVQQNTGQLDKIKAALADCTTKPAAFNHDSRLLLVRCRTGRRIWNFGRRLHWLL